MQHIADPQTSWKKSQPWSGSSHGDCWNILVLLCPRDHLDMALSSPPGLSAPSASCPRHILPRQVYPLVYSLGVATVARGTPKGLDFPMTRQKGAAAFAVYARLPRMSCQPSALPSWHKAGLWLQAPSRPGYAPEHTLLTATSCDDNSCPSHGSPNATQPSGSTLCSP